MHNLSLSHHQLKTASRTNIADSIAWHLAEHQVYGTAAIVVDDPVAFMVQLQKAWHKLQRELAADGDKHRDTLNLMRYCTFTTRLPIEESSAWVQIATITEFLRWPPNCRTMYIASKITTTQLHQVTAWMPPYGEVVIYKNLRK